MRLAMETVVEFWRVGFCYKRFLGFNNSSLCARHNDNFGKMFFEMGPKNSLPTPMKPLSDMGGARWM